MTHINGRSDFDAGYHYGCRLVWPVEGPTPRKGNTFGRGMYEGRRDRKADQKAVHQPGGDLAASQRLTQAGWFNRDGPPEG